MKVGFNIYAKRLPRKTLNFYLTCGILYWSHEVQPTYIKTNHGLLGDKKEPKTIELLSFSLIFLLKSPLQKRAKISRHTVRTIWPLKVYKRKNQTWESTCTACKSWNFEKTWIFQYFKNFCTEVPLKNFQTWFKTVGYQKGLISHRFPSYAHGTDASQTRRFDRKVFANNFSVKNFRTSKIWDMANCNLAVQVFKKLQDSSQS